MYGAVPVTRAGQVLCCPGEVPRSARRSCDGGRQMPPRCVSASPEIISTGAKPAVFCGANRELLFRHILCLLVSNWLYLWIYRLPCPPLHLDLRHLYFFVEPRPQHRHHACHERPLREQLGVPYDATVSTSRRRRQSAGCTLRGGRCVRGPVPECRARHSHTGSKQSKVKSAAAVRGGRHAFEINCLSLP